MLRRKVRKYCRWQTYIPSREKPTLSAQERSLAPKGPLPWQEECTPRSVSSRSITDLKWEQVEGARKARRVPPAPVCGETREGSGEASLHSHAPFFLLSSHPLAPSVSPPLPSVSHSIRSFLPCSPPPSSLELRASFSISCSSTSISQRAPRPFLSPTLFSPASFHTSNKTPVFLLPLCQHTYKAHRPPLLFLYGRLSPLPPTMPIAYASSSSSSRSIPAVASYLHSPRSSPSPHVAFEDLTHPSSLVPCGAHSPALLELMRSEVTPDMICKCLLHYP